MSKVDDDCTICLTSLHQTLQISTECDHRFHFECIRKNIEAGNDKCPLCNRSLHALISQFNINNPGIIKYVAAGGQEKDLKKPSSQSSACASLSASEYEKEWACERCTCLNRSTTRKCDACDLLRPSAFASATTSGSFNTKPESFQSKGQETTELQHKKHVSRLTEADVWDEWFCSSCTYLNMGSDRVCTICNEGTRPVVQPTLRTNQHKVRNRSPSQESFPSQSRHRSPSVEIIRYPFSTKMSSSSTSRPKSTHEDVSVPTDHETFTVYIPDLPAGKSDTQLEQMIRQRLHNDPQVSIVDIKCYARFSVGILQVQNAANYQHLISNVRSIVLNPPHSTAISFTDTLELVSYIVFDPKIKTIPTKNEILQRWVQVYRIARPEQCERVSVLYPNIFRIVFTSFDDLLHVSTIGDFAVNSEFATVYFRADCSYFEDLPATLSQAELLSTIAMRIGLTTSLASSLYVQINRDAKNAIVLAADQARKWIHETILYCGTQVLTKKEHLAYRLLLQPVPHSCSIQSILQHNLFRGGIVKYTQKEERLVVELNDRDMYDHILTIGALRVDQHQILIKAYSALDDPEGSEITAETWYETRMLDYKPDIMSFVIDRQHPIFRYKWNWKIWLEQFKKTDALNQSIQDQNRIRHLLRMTTMLNTIGAIRKKSYSLDDNKEIKLRDESLKTIVYNHQSKLFSATKTSSTNYIAKFPSTTVEVTNRDCLIVYQQLASSGRQPLLLNMANQISPGGGYRRGDGAQEENLFRRSNYCLSLDVEMSESNRSERFQCTSDGQLKSISRNDQMYPMDEFGAIYTSGITVFRHSEDRGYAFIEEPMYNVCALAMAAYREPKLKNQMLAGKFAAGMRKKIENIFAIAHHQKHDCLILSALGCGAFKNPPHHVAALFRSVIHQYAGYFRSIYFAIIDDHNTGNQLNPQGNFLPFQKELDVHAVSPQNLKLANMASGPFRLLNNVQSDSQLDLSDAYIFDLTPCQYGAKCHDLYDIQHIKSFSHPSMCPNQSDCKNIHDDVHMFSFIHRTVCRDGGECEKIKDVKHVDQYDHPDFCPKGGACTDMGQEHLIASQHVPLCDHGLKCQRYLNLDYEHRRTHRHCRLKCPHGGFCAKFHDEQHLQDQDHPFQQSCPYTPFHCEKHIEYIQSKNPQASIRTHCLQYSHVCPFGRECNDTSELHAQVSIHIPRQMCSDLDQCTKTDNEEHLSSFSHPKIRDIRLLCSYPGYECRDRFKIEHRHRYRHAKNHDFAGIMGYFALNNRTDFLHNQSEMTKALNDYIETQKWHKPAIISPEITDWVRSLEPIHRCKKVIFESILVHNHLMSREQMNLLREARFVANAVVQHGLVRHIFKRLNNPTLENHGRDFIQAIVGLEFDKNPLKTKNPAMFQAMPVTITTSSSSSDHQYTIEMKENVLRQSINQADMDTIKSCAVSVAKASLNLCQDPMGIGYGADKTLGTDKHIFSILGPHRGQHYGDIILIFKRELMLHPDSNFTIQSATSFHSGNGYQWRPWFQDPGQIDDRVKDFHMSKLHCSISGYETAAARQLMALAGKDKKTVDVDLKAILKYWSKVDSHMVFEGHLPQLIPLDYIDHVYIPQDVFDSLTAEAQQAAKTIFRRTLTISDKTGKAYESFVYDEFIKRIELNMNKPSLLRGMMITLPSSGFYYQIPLPMTITQSYNIFNHKKSKTGFHQQPELTLVYWQAMHGDMMVTISNEPIDCRQEQASVRCLICYVAEVPLMNSHDYHESSSYLSNGHPLKHDVISREATFKAGSRRFFRGCNTDDYLTFCLKIERLQDRVSLCHAGPNSLYNHEVITAEFRKNEVDLSKLNFVHVSAGTGTVPVKNIVIRHEPIDHLHPSLDTKYKKISIPVVASSAGSSPSKKSHDVKSEPKNEGIFSKIANAVLSSFSPSSLTPCQDSVNCLKRELPEHNTKYSHPCRYSELCENMNAEPHLTHTPHKISKCKFDRSCSQLEDPVHRGSYRHSKMPDFFIPCRHQQSCYDKSPKHRQLYSHGEQVPVPDGVSSKQSSDRPSASKQKQSYQDSSTSMIPCRHGRQCRDQNDQNHASQYSHPDS